MGAGTAPVVRIGGAGGFYGDRVRAPVEMLESTQLDYLTMDYLAELTMSILAKQRARDRHAGWAADLADWLGSGGIEALRSGGVRLVTNAGGANPRACAEEVLSLAIEEGWEDCRVALVTGDDLIPGLNRLNEVGESLDHMETGEGISSVRARLSSVNAYLGAGAISRALARGVDIVVTGRGADPALTLGCMLHHAGWAARAEAAGLPLAGPVHTWAPPDEEDVLDRMAGWTLAGHLIECGAQITGGNSSDWADVPDLARVGYPVAEVHLDGTCVITKPEASGGRVSRRTVAEQLVYEIGDPAEYVTPDVGLDLRQVELEDVGEERVRVSGCRGTPPPERLKVSAAYRDGWFAAAELLVGGEEAEARAHKADDVLRERLSLAGVKEARIGTELFGTGSADLPGLPVAGAAAPEVLIRWAIASPHRRDVITFSREVAPLVLTGPAGVSGYSARAKPREQHRFWPALVERGIVEEGVQLEVLQRDTFEGLGRPALEVLRIRVSQASARLERELMDWLDQIKRTVPEDRLRRRMADRLLELRRGDA